MGRSSLFRERTPPGTRARCMCDALRAVANSTVGSYGEKYAEFGASVGGSLARSSDRPPRDDSSGWWTKTCPARRTSLGVLNRLERPNCRVFLGASGGRISRCQRRSLRVVGKEDSLPVWAWLLIIVLLVLLLTGGVYVRR